jgi:hypothetical protein
MAVASEIMAVVDFVVTPAQPGASGRITKSRKWLKFFYFGPLRFRASGFESRWGATTGSFLHGGGASAS